MIIRRARPKDVPLGARVICIAWVAALFMPMLLGGCAAGSSGPTPKATVLSMESALTAAETTATVYTKLAPCTGTNGPLCSDPATKAALKDADMRAYAAVTAAQTAVDADPTASATGTQAAVSAATAALAAFQAATAPLPKGATP